MSTVTLTSKSVRDRTRVFQAITDAADSGGGLWTVTVKRIEYDGTLDPLVLTVGTLPPKDTEIPITTGQRCIIVLTWDGVRVAVPVESTGALEHNDLDGLQGGDPAIPAYFHLSEAQYDQLIDEGVIDPVPVDCNQLIHPGDEVFDVDGTVDDHPGAGAGTGSVGTDYVYDPDGYTDHPGVEDCYTTR